MSPNHRRPSEVAGRGLPPSRWPLCGQNQDGERPEAAAEESSVNTTNVGDGTRTEPGRDQEGAGTGRGEVWTAAAFCQLVLSSA